MNDPSKKQNLKLQSTSRHGSDSKGQTISSFGMLTLETPHLMERGTKVIATAGSNPSLLVELFLRATRAFKKIT